MQSISEKDRANISGLLEAIRKIQEYVRGIKSAREYFNSAMVFDATLMNFVLIGELVDRLSDDLKQRNRTIDWQRIKGFRNLVAHDYFGIDAEEVWQIIHNDIPKLGRDLKHLSSLS
jgi:uncharacterized protein with HEPN domain